MKKYILIFLQFLKIFYLLFLVAGMLAVIYGVVAHTESSTGFEIATVICSLVFILVIVVLCLLENGKFGTVSSEKKHVINVVYILLPILWGVIWAFLSLIIDGFRGAIF